MRVITGTARGRKLSAPEGYAVRPTTDKVKEAVFSAIQFDVSGAAVLDLFSGSGQMGIEALSRGAESAVFVDSSKASIMVTKANITSVGFDNLSKVYHMDSLDYLKKCAVGFDLVFADPPYNKGLALASLELLDRNVNNNGKVIIEHEPELKMPEAFGWLVLKRNYRYGKVNISLYEKCKEEE